MEKNISLFSTLTPSHKKDFSEVSYVRKGDWKQTEIRTENVDAHV